MNILWGNHRVVLYAAGFVLKFPRVQILPPPSRGAWRGSLGYAKKHIKKSWLQFITGCVANLTEYASWLEKPSRFKARVYFSLGFLTVQRYEQGQTLTKDQLKELLNHLPGEAKLEMEAMNTHAFCPSNFRRTERGVVMVDYGAGIRDEHQSITAFVYTWDEKLTKILCP